MLTLTLGNINYIGVASIPEKLSQSFTFFFFGLPFLGYSLGFFIKFLELCHAFGLVFKPVGPKATNSRIKQKHGHDATQKQYDNNCKTHDAKIICFSKTSKKWRTIKLILSSISMPIKVWLKLARQ